MDQPSYPRGDALPAIAGASVQIAFPPSMDIVDRIIRWLSDFCHLSPGDLDVSSRLQLAVYELVENIVKYGKDSRVRVELSVAEVPEGTVLKLCTRNQAEQARLSQAVKILTDLQQTDDPVAYYDRLVLDTAPKEGVSGLGLARIVAEAELDLDFEVQGDVISISVQTFVPRPKAN